MHIIVLQIEITTNSIVGILAVRFKLENCDLSINTMYLYEIQLHFGSKYGQKEFWNEYSCQKQEKVDQKFASSKFYSYICLSILKYRTWIRAD